MILSSKKLHKENSHNFDEVLHCHKSHWKRHKFIKIKEAWNEYQILFISISFVEIFYKNFNFIQTSYSAMESI